MKNTLFIEGGTFYRGNIHTHSTISDGKLSVEELKAEYKSRGYSFLAITDHNVYGDYSYLDEEGFIFLSGVEIDTFSDGKAKHIIGLGVPGRNSFKHLQKLSDLTKGKQSMQEMVDVLCENGNLAIVAHPRWSKLDFDDLTGTKGITGFEIYNNVCEMVWCNGNSEIYCDKLVASSNHKWLFASDDLHWLNEHAIGGFIMVKAKSLTAADIIDSIEKGSFYASNGPLIYDYYAEGKKVFIKCSKVSKIYLMNDNYYEECAWIFGKDGITSAEFEFKKARSVRAVIVDDYGRRAYTNPLFL